MREAYNFDLLALACAAHIFRIHGLPVRRLHLYDFRRRTRRNLIHAVNGVFSERMYEIATRASSKIVKVEAPYGKPVDAEDVRRAGKGKKIKIVGFAHGETSTGVITGIDAYRKVADELGALLIVDTVASLAAVPVDVDKQRIDICFSGSQKAISAPPGMSPITVSPAAEEVFRKRKTKVQ